MPIAPTNSQRGNRSKSNAPLHSHSNYNRIVEQMRLLAAMAVIWNPFRALNNLTHGGTHGDSGLPVIEQFVPHVLHVQEGVDIKPKTANAEQMAVTGQPVGSDVKQIERSAVQIAADLIRIHGEKGVVRLESLSANGLEEMASNLIIYEVVMSGWKQNGILQDLPEYFGDAPGYLHNKPKAVAGKHPDSAFLYTAADALKIAGGDGILIKIFRSEVLDLYPDYRSYLKSPCILTDAEVEKGFALIEELKQSTRTMHEYAVGELGILPGTKDHLEQIRNGAVFGKRKYDELDIYLMRQFPSFSMDTEIEKAQAQFTQGLNSILQQGSASAVPSTGNDRVEQLERQLADERKARAAAESNFASLDNRLKAIESGKPGK